MSVFADLVLADAELFEKADQKYEDTFNWKSANGLTLNMLVSLYCLLVKKKFSKTLYKSFPTIQSSSPGISSIHKIPSALKNSLSNLESHNVKAISKQWFQDEPEFSSLRIPSDAAERLLANLCSLAQSGQNSQENIYIVSK